MKQVSQLSTNNKRTIIDFKQSSINLYGGVNSFSQWADQLLNKK